MNDFVIEQVTSYSPVVADELRRLVAQLGGGHTELKQADIEEMISSPNTYIFVAKSQNEIAGMATLLVFRIPYKKKAFLEDLVVDSKYRNMGIATKLLERVIEVAREKKASSLNFTSRPERIEGNSLYQKLGFEKRDTNVYHLALNHGND